jgi:hypothetical protein
MQSLFSFDLDALDSEHIIHAEETQEKVPIPDKVAVEEEEIKSLFPACSICPDETYPISSF